VPGNPVLIQITFYAGTILSGSLNKFYAVFTSGRVGEFGGHGNISTLIAAMKEAVGTSAGMGEFKNPWYLPSTTEYRTHLAHNGSM